MSAKVTIIVPVYNTADYLQNCIDSIKNIKWKIIKQKTFKENKLLNLESNKALKKLKWKPVLDTKSSLDLTVKWYKNCSRNNEENYNFTLKQINYFKNLL